MQVQIKTPEAQNQANGKSDTLYELNHKKTCLMPLQNKCRPEQKTCLHAYAEKKRTIITLGKRDIQLNIFLISP